MEKQDFPTFLTSPRTFSFSFSFSDSCATVLRLTAHALSPSLTHYHLKEPQFLARQQTCSALLGIAHHFHVFQPTWLAKMDLSNFAQYLHVLYKTKFEHLLGNTCFLGLGCGPEAGEEWGTGSPDGESDAWSSGWQKLPPLSRPDVGLATNCGHVGSCPASSLTQIKSISTAEQEGLRPDPLIKVASELALPSARSTL